MPATAPTALAVAHRLLFDALVEIRAAGHDSKNKLVFHLADLFHNAALDLGAAAAGEMSYEEVLRRLDEKARETRCERWLEAVLRRAEDAGPVGGIPSGNSTSLTHCDDREEVDLGNGPTGSRLSLARRPGLTSSVEQAKYELGPGGEMKPASLSIAELYRLQGQAFGERFRVKAINVRRTLLEDFVRAPFGAIDDDLETIARGIVVLQKKIAAGANLTDEQTEDFASRLDDVVADAIVVIRRCVEKFKDRHAPEFQLEAAKRLGIPVAEDA